jgi:hypothetical protein
MNHATDATDADHEDHPVEQSESRYLDELCEDLSRWAATRKLYGAPRGPVSLLGQLAKRTRPLRSGGGPDAANSAFMAAMWIAYTAQPRTDAHGEPCKDRLVFELHYLHRVTSIKTSAAAIGIGRQHWYTLLADFRRRIHAAAHDIAAANEQARAALASSAPANHSPMQT